MPLNKAGWQTWQDFRADQQELVLPAGAAAHIPVTIRCIDQGEARLGTVLLMHGIPTWGYLYQAVIPPQAIEGASHWIQQDAPEQFSQALLAFLASD